MPAPAAMASRPTRCGARRMAETAALLADEVFPEVPLRQWVLSVPFPLHYLFAAHPHAMGKVLGIVYRAIATHLIHDAGGATMVRAELEDRAESSRAIRLNGWRTVTFEAFAESAWFCDGGLG